MPIYCYKCFECGHYQEIKQKFEDPELNICPECGVDQFKRVIRSVGIVFKGKGFHVTDYSGQKAQPPAPESSPGPAPDTKKETSSSSGDKTPSGPSSSDGAKSH